jgi:O-methyltransferase
MIQKMLSYIAHHTPLLCQLCNFIEEVRTALTALRLRTDELDIYCKDSFIEIHDQIGGLTQHHGDALTDFGTRLWRLEEQFPELVQQVGTLTQHHGDALTDFGTRLWQLEEQFPELVQQVGTLTQYHGDALTDFGTRLWRLEELVTGAANYRGRLTMAEKRQVTTQTRLEKIEKLLSETKIKSKGELSLPHGNYLGHTPERYNKNLDRYFAGGGVFDPDLMSEKYKNGDMVRLYSFMMIFDIIRQDMLRGDLAELGVWKGDTAIIIATFAREYGRKAFLLDTYQGFDLRDLAGEGEHLASKFSDTSVEAVKKRIGENDVQYVVGYFPETAAQLPEENEYCFVNIDCDLHDPVLAGLEYFYPRVVPGGFIVIHDYMSNSWDGPIKAVNAFFADKPESIVPMADFAGSVMVRKSRIIPKE